MEQEENLAEQAEEVCFAFADKLSTHKKREFVESREIRDKMHSLSEKYQERTSSTHAGDASVEAVGIVKCNETRKKSSRELETK